MDRTFTVGDLAKALEKQRPAMLHTCNMVLPVSVQEQTERHAGKWRRLSFTDCALVSAFLEARRVGLEAEPARWVFSSGWMRGFFDALLTLPYDGAISDPSHSPERWTKWLQLRAPMVGAGYKIEQRGPQTDFSASPFIATAATLPQRLQDLEPGRTIFVTSLVPALLPLARLFSQDAAE